jgi:hypothetical protein
MGTTMRTAINEVTAIATTAQSAATLDSFSTEPTKTCVLKIEKCTNLEARHKDAQPAVVFRIAEKVEAMHGIDPEDTSPLVAVAFSMEHKGFIVDAPKTIIEVIETVAELSFTTPMTNVRYELKYTTYTGKSVSDGKRIDNMNKGKVFVEPGTAEMKHTGAPLVQEAITKALNTVNLKVTRISRGKGELGLLNFYYFDCDVHNPDEHIDAHRLYRIAEPKTTSGSTINIKMHPEFLKAHGLCEKCQRTKNASCNYCICTGEGSSSGGNKRKYGEPSKTKKALQKYARMGA